MTATFKYDEVTGAISLTDGSTLRWSTDYAPAMLLPDANKIELTGHTISFPDFVKSNMMWFGVVTSAGIDFSDAMSWVNILPGEWSPYASASPYILTRELLGTVPDGVNYLDVRVNLTRTTAPSQYQGADVPPTIKEGQSVFADGGFLVLEHAVGWVRAIRIRLIGAAEAAGLGITSGVYLERYQSVRRKQFCVDSASVIKTGSQVWTSGGYAPWANLWTWGGADITSAGGFLAAIIQYISSGNINKQRGGANAPSTVDPTDYSSVYTGTITIRPGIVDAQDAVTPTAPVAPSRLINWRAAAESGSLTGVPDSVYYAYGIPMGDPYADRKVVVCVMGNPATDVSVNGVSATLLHSAVFPYADPSWWVADVSTETTATIAVSTVGESGGSYRIDVFTVAGAGTLVKTDAASASSPATNGNSSVTIATASGGFALAVAQADTGYGTPTLTGDFTLDDSTPYSSITIKLFAGHIDPTDGSNVSWGISLGTGASTTSAISFN